MTRCHMRGGEMNDRNGEGSRSGGISWIFLTFLGRIPVDKGNSGMKFNETQVFTFMNCGAVMPMET